MFSAWLVSKDISKLQPHEIESYINEPYKKSGDLLQGYRIALDPSKWEQEIQAATQLAVEEEANAEIDELESEREDEESGKGKSKKRKRVSDAGSKARKGSIHGRGNIKLTDGVIVSINQTQAQWHQVQGDGRVRRRG